MKYLSNYKLYENIQQGKSILKSKNISTDDPRWKTILDVFKKSPGYVGTFTDLVFNRNWDVNVLSYIYDNFINNQRNKSIFNSIYDGIENYSSSEFFIDDLMKLKREKDIKDIYDRFPIEQKNIINTVRNKNKLLHELSLRKDNNSFIRKISRYHDKEQLVDALNLFLSSKIIDSYNEILEKVKSLSCEIIISDKNNDLIIVKVDYDQLKKLAGHTSWCILEKSTFDSYNRVCNMYIIYLTDIRGNESMIGATIGTNITTSHYINDDRVYNLPKILSIRNFDVSTLYMSEDFYIKKEIDVLNISDLLRKYKPEVIFKYRKSFKYWDFKTEIYNKNKDWIDEFNLKCDASYEIPYRDMYEYFKNGWITNLTFYSNIVNVYEKFGDEIIPFLSEVNLDKTLSNFPILLTLYEKVNGFKFKTYKQVKEKTKIQLTSIEFMLDRGIKMDYSDISKIMKSNKYGNNYYEVLKLIPKLFDFLVKEKDGEGNIKNESYTILLKIKTIKELSNNEDLNTLIFNSGRSESYKYIKNIIPNPTYSNFGKERGKYINFLKEENIDPEVGFGPKDFESDNIWGKIKEFDLLNYGWGTDDHILLCAVMSFTKLNLMEELLPYIKNISYRIDKIIKTSFNSDDSDYGYFYNHGKILPENFYLDDVERERLFQWICLHVSDVVNTSNIIVDKELIRHRALSLIYYTQNWGFDKYIKIVSNVKPKKEDTWKVVNGSSWVEKSINRPSFFTDIIEYLIILNKEEEIYDLLEIILDMKNLMIYEVEKLVIDILKVFDKKINMIFFNHGWDIHFPRNYDSIYDFKIKKIK